MFTFFFDKMYESPPSFLELSLDGLVDDEVDNGFGDAVVRGTHPLVEAPHSLGKKGRMRGDVLTHFCPPFQHLLSERLTSLGQQMLERWAKMG